MTSQAGEPTLADVCSASTPDGIAHATPVACITPADAGPGEHAPVKGEDPLDLRHQLQRAEALQE